MASTNLRELILTEMQSPHISLLSSNKNKVTRKDPTAYIVDLSNIDSVLACEYLLYYMRDNLSYIVIHNNTLDKICKENIKHIQSFIDKQTLLEGTNQTQIVNEIPADTLIVICGAPYTKVKDFVKNYCEKNNHYLKYLSGAGGYGGKQGYQLKQSIIFNQDIESIKYILKHGKEELIQIISLYGENVTDIPENTPTGSLWQDNLLAQQLFKKHHITNNNLRLNYLLTAHENLASGTLKAIKKARLLKQRVHRELTNPVIVASRNNSLAKESVLVISEKCFVAKSIDIE